MNIVFGPVQFEKLKKLLSQAERELLPSSFADIVISYFDDCFVFADNYEQLLVCFKICLRYLNGISAELRANAPVVAGASEQVVQSTGGLSAQRFVRPAQSQ